MSGKNILIGNGERLTTPIPPPPGGGSKNHPYTYSQSKQRLVPKLRSLIKNVHDMPEQTKVHGESVIRMTMHPAYLAKSYYPDNLIRNSGLRNIGSKEVIVKPERTQKEGEPVEEVSSCYYLTCTENMLEAMLSHIEADDFNKTTQQQLTYIEAFDFFKSEDKIKYIDDSTTLLEVVLHASESDRYTMQTFFNYAKQLNGQIEREDTINVGGLTFLSMQLPHKNVNDLAKFSMLRAVRSMPKLRIYEPEVTRTINKNVQITLPSKPAINQEITVAIFDGGIGPIDNYDSWVNEIDLTGGATTNTQLLQHGSDVTSTFLFGRLKEGDTELTQPYANVDHYRVLTAESGNNDYNLLLVLKRIKQVLDSKEYDFINLSLGPDIPIEDDDVHAWTSVLDNYLKHGRTLATVAVGNRGDLGPEQGRIQPPSDMVNALSVGAADSSGPDWERAFYSCLGLGRSPGKIKPDGVMFGGSPTENFILYSPWEALKVQMGTSFSSPLTLRTSAIVKTALDYQLNAMTLKALMIHHAERKAHHEKDQIGWGRFPESADSIITCNDNEATVIYQGELLDGGWIKTPIPLPEIDYKGNIAIKATFCYATELEPEHPVSYTKSGLEVIFRKNQKPKKNTESFFQKKHFQSEIEARYDAHKWETVLHNEINFRKTSLDHPNFDIVYRSREGGGAVQEDLPALPYVLIVTIKANNTPELYNQVLQQYRVLQAIKLRQEIQLDRL